MKKKCGNRKACQPPPLRAEPFRRVEPHRRMGPDGRRKLPGNLRQSGRWQTARSRRTPAPKSFQFHRKSWAAQKSAAFFALFLRSGPGRESLWHSIFCRARRWRGWSGR